VTPEAVIVATARTPIGRAARGSLAGIRAEDLLAAAVDGALRKVDALDPRAVDDVLVGAWLHQGAQGGNLARRLAVLQGWDSVPGTTVNRACASSLQTLRMATHAIRAGEGRAFIAAGVESVSGYAERRAAGTTPDDDKHPTFRAAERPLHERWSDPREAGLVPDVHLAMGLTAENVARLRGVSRAEQDDFAVVSQQRTAAAVERGFFAKEIVPISIDGRMVDRDDSPRPGTTREALAALEPAFAPDGTVTAGNCCPLSDGAAALVVMSDDYARELGLTPLARVVATGVSALSPEIMGLGPVDATREALNRAGMTSSDLDLVEINEAFAAQVLPCLDDLKVPLDITNVNGGAIALGHPFGMGGARLTTTLINTMVERDAQIGLVTLCAAGGQGMSVILERVG
jgi:acetyl-CoA C-acetyltransferase